MLLMTQEAGRRNAILSKDEITFCVKIGVRRARLVRCRQYIVAPPLLLAQAPRQFIMNKPSDFIGRFALMTQYVAMRTYVT